MMCNPQYKCPKCNDYRNLQVVGMVWAKVCQNNAELELDTGSVSDRSVDFDDASQMKCNNCGFAETSIEFKNKRAS